MGSLTKTEAVVCIICGLGALLSIIVGYTVPSTGAYVLKDFMVFFGGAGIAFALANAGARAAINDRIRSVCKRSVQRLGLTAYHARDASNTIREQGRSESADLIATMLEHLAEEAQVSMGDWEEVAGGALGLDPLVAGSLEEITKAAESVPGEDPEKRKLLDAVSQFRELLKGGAPALSQRPLPATVACPSCAREVSAPLGALAGDTASVKCGYCGAAFSIHRILSGGVRLGRQTNRATCPGCGKSIVIPVQLGGSGETLVRNCFDCDLRLEISAASGQVLKAEKQTPLEAALSVAENGQRTVACPSCKTVSTVNPSYRGEVIKVTCVGCTKLIRATAPKKQKT